MAFGSVHRFPGGTKEQYEAALAQVHPPDGSLPEGQTYHIAGATDDGWIVIALFDSEESWERYRDQTLMPGLGCSSSATRASRGRRNKLRSRSTRWSRASRRDWRNAAGP
jgi:crotonobetainyl-CoA:carnitine CoA-transferase CaiB-like acyl-CoA transferase